jgi:nucleotide-binding universal stress UspA family protein
MEASKSSSTPAMVSSPYRRILVPHDGSEMSDRAFKHAMYVAKMANAEIVIFMLWKLIVYLQAHYWHS